MHVSRRDHLVLALVLSLLAIGVLGPALAPGFVLTYDMVFVPRQNLLPWMLGLDDAPPRSVPQDAWIALITPVLHGALLQKVCLVAVVVVAGAGAAALLRPSGIGVRCLAAVMTVWTPFVAERLVLGSWSLLLAYALLPWVLLTARRVRETTRGSAALLLLVALGSVTPTGGLLLASVAVAVLMWPGSRRGIMRIGAVTFGVVMLQATWALPAVLGGSGASDRDGVEAFALNPEGSWGVLLTAFGTGGVWNADVVPASRSLLTAPIVTLLLLVLACIGFSDLSRKLGRPVTGALSVAALLGMLVALSSALPITRDAHSWVVVEVPGGGLLRDAQKWLLPWTLLLGLSAAVGSARLVRRIADGAARGAVLTACAVLAFASVPDLVWGVSGRLHSVEYPDDWVEVRAVLEQAEREGDVVSLPMSAFRTYAWNEGDTVLDPAPRYLPRTVVVDGRLPVATEDGTLLVAGEDRRADAVREALRLNLPLSEVVPALGIRWLLVQIDQPASLPSRALDGSRLVVRGTELELYEVDRNVTPRGLPPWTPVVVVVDAALLVVIGGAALVVTSQWFRRRHGPNERPGQKARPAILESPDREVE